jgi:hypothetical protein
MVLANTITGHTTILIEMSSDIGGDRSLGRYDKEPCRAVCPSINYFTAQHLKALRCRGNTIIALT